MKIKVIVTLKNGVLDPQGKAIQQTLNGMNFDKVSDVRQGKFFEIEVKENDEVDVYCTFFDHDKKRLHLKCEMYEKKSKKLAATIESLSLYIDLDKRKVTEFEQDKIQIMDDFINKNKVSFNSENLMFSVKLKK